MLAGFRLTEVEMYSQPKNVKNKDVPIYAHTQIKIIIAADVQ